MYFYSFIAFFNNAISIVASFFKVGLAIICDMFGTQMLISVMSLSIEDKKIAFPCIGYPIYKGNHMIIKYAVDGVEKENEE